MDRCVARQMFGTAVVAVAVSLGVSAQPRPPQANPAANAAAIRLRAATFTPSRGERPAIPDTLTLRDEPAGRRGYYIVQFDGPIEEAWKASLVAAGADVLDYIPDFALKVRMAPGQVLAVTRLPRVQWVGPFQPGYKLPPDVVRDAQVRPYVVSIERGADVDAAQRAIAATGARVLHRDGATLTVAANARMLDAVAHVLDVATIESFAIRQKHNEFGGRLIGAEIAHAAGYDGSTQTIAVSDTGLGGGTAATAHRDLPASRITALFNWPGVPSACFETVFNDGPVDVDTGHGTHVAASAVGGGNGAGVGRGTAPGSRLVFQAIEDFAIPSLLCQLLLGLPPGYYLTGIPADVSALFQQSYDAGARVHSNSWGSASNGAYTADSANTDAFLWTHRDLAITMSAGNSGIDANLDGIVDGMSINAPGTAKNVITVGASEGSRDANYDCDSTVGQTCTGQNNIFTYGSAFGAAFRANPLKDDPSAGNAQQMAAFSSRGPAADGRIKPDVVAPGTWILSGYSDQFQKYYDASPNPRNNAFQYDGWGDPLDDTYKYMGGTSMSAPLVAGAAAVVRDYYQKARGHSASAALVKATLVNSAVDLLDENNDGVDDNAYAIPNMHEGWGRVDLATATDGTRQFFDESVELATGNTSVQTVTVDASLRPLRVTLAWTDAPASTSAALTLVNDLDLEVIAPDGTTYRGNSFVDGWSFPSTSADRTNNLENVYVVAPTAGEWTVAVRGYNVPQGPQSFALVIGRQADVVTQTARVSVVATDATATEAGRTTGTFTLTRSGNLATPLMVSYAISGTALPDADYAALTNNVTFAAGSGEATVVIDPVDDAVVEVEESVVLTVIAGESYGIRAPFIATITIVSDDQPGDLTVSEMVAPATAAGGSTITVTDTTRNQGSWPTETAKTGFYLSLNSLLDAADAFLGDRDVPALAAGAADTQSTILTLPVNAAGRYYVLAKADHTGAIVETTESNNVRASALVRVGPDLVVTAQTIPWYAGAGSAISVGDTTRNDGAQTSGESTTAYYLSTNATWDAADARLGSRNVPSLLPGASHQGTATVTIPAATVVGIYYVIARADDLSVVSEATETNNTRAAGSLKVGPDLIVAALSAPTTAAPGGTVAISDTTRNQGGAPASNFVTAFYLSANTTLDASDVRLGARSVALLDAGADSTVTTNFALPMDLEVGAYYVIAVADDTAVVNEPVESNNRRTTSTQLKVGPDLTITSVTAPLLGGAGGTISVTDTVKNVGAAASPATETVLFLSANTTLDQGDRELGRRVVGPLEAGASQPATTSVTIPADTVTGSYFVIAVVDLGDAIDEPVETNNSYRSGTIRIGPDLSVVTLTVPTSFAAGATINVSDTTKNTGGGAAAASTTAFYLSANSALDGGDIALGTRAVPALAAGASHVLTTTVTVPPNTAAGTYYLIANANDTLSVVETLTSNNSKRIIVKVSP